MSVPAIRIKRRNERPVARDGDYVLYWMTANRRLGWNFALQRAVEHCVELGKPLLIFEALRAGYQWASDRLHRFVIDGMIDNRRGCAARGVTYHAYVEPIPDAGKGLLVALAERACVVVGDDYPAFFLPRMHAVAAARVAVAYESVDANGVLPLRATDKAYPSAAHFRRLLQAKLPLFLRQMPAADPLAALAGTPAAVVPPAVAARWPAVDPGRIALSGLLIDHHVPPVAMRGGETAATARMRDFISADLVAYGQVRNQPDDDRTSRLSPYLHFGHISAHQVLAETLEHAHWSPDRLASRASGAKEGWWGVDAGSESFIDQLITWRELGFIFADHVPDYDDYETLPPWARASLERHAGDPRPQVYTLDEFAAAATHDPLWNAAQTQLLREGRIHNYLRMLWGKKIIEWSPSPRAALAIMFALNNRWAIDGRDPNSTSGICWCLGRFDRPWPERPIFGVIRWMSSQNTAKKLDVKGYLARYAPA